MGSVDRLRKTEGSRPGEIRTLTGVQTEGENMELQSERQGLGSRTEESGTL